MHTTRETVPVDMRHQALGTGYKEIAALMRTRLRDKAVKSVEVASIEKSVGAIRRLYYMTMRGTVALSPYIPSFSDAAHDVSCVGTAYPPQENPAMAYMVAPVRRSELFVGAATVEQNARLSLLFASCAATPCTLIEREGTRGADVIPSGMHASIRTHIAALAKAYEYLLFQSLCCPDAEWDANEASSRARASYAHRFSSAASTFRQMAMLDAIAFTIAGRWKRANALTPLLSFLTCHAVIGMRGTTLFVLYE
jgi:hypothetical protein